ncbi:MAG: electron transport complex protein RnfA [Gammaproteobacteria bacterium]|jgi:electron transport complex protein RnfA
MGDALALMLAGALGSDLLLVYLIGVCPAIAVSRKLETAAGLAVSNIFIAPLACVISFLVLNALPNNSATTILELPIIVTSIIVCLYFTASVGERIWRAGHAWLEPFVPLMTVNCTMLGVVLIVLIEPNNVIEVFLYSAGLAGGYAFFIVVFSQIRERLAAAPVPRAFRDSPIALLSIGIIAMAMSGFGGTS